MGIRGLTRFIKANAADAFKTRVLARGSTVIIDGNGWIFSLLQRPQARTIMATPGMLKGLFPRNIPMEPLSRTDGGDYDLLDLRVKVFVGLMRRAGMNIEVFWDGPLVPKFKEQVLRMRNEERSTEEMKLFRHCNHGERFAEEEYPLLPLALQQLRTTLAGLKVPQIECSSEADSILALKSARDKTGRTYVLGNDSDFFLFKNCRYVNFSDIVFVRDRQIKDKSGQQVVQVVVNVYTRAALSKVLAVSEEFLVDFGIYLGNDYTGPFARSGFKCMDKDSKKITLPFIPETSNALAAILENVKQGAIFSDNNDQQLAIDFSRLLYNLEPLSAFEFRPKNSPVGDEDRKTTIGEMVDGLLDASTQSDSAQLIAPEENIVQAALRIMSTKLPDLIPVTTMNQVRRAVLEAIAMGKYKVPAHDQHQVEDQNLTWDDVRFAFCYQHICRILYSCLQRGHAPPTAWLEPRQLFSGPAYRRLLHIYRTKTDNPSSTPSPAEDPAKASALPIDAHRDRILDHIRRHRVTIIHGETGCGKSSRVPVMLYNDCTYDKQVKLFVSQPRRIACTALHDRVSKELGDAVGLRLGHGHRVETRKTRIWYCTAGYLKLLSAHNPKIFKTHTHLIIDEIHERSVDTDLLCFFAKELLVTHPHLKLILMSATLCVDTYRKYFDVEEDAIFVGVKRFALTEYYLEDIAHMKVFPRMIQSRANQVERRLQSTSKSARDVPKSAVESQTKLAVDVAKAVARPGRSVLIFVAGIYEIGQIAEEFDECQDVFRLVAIHSQIPFEEQLQAFQPDPVRATVVVATNAAESSITLPDCDNVICLGSAKRIEYNTRKRRVQLVLRWISKASAVQRAGRTARVAPGTVWRLYPKDLFARMREFEPPEMHQIPLDHVVLQLRSQISDRSVVDILRRVLDPPDLTHIEHAFASLYKYGYITEASDEGDITDSGDIAVRLGLDLNLTKVVIYGIHLGVAKEAVCMAAALAQQDLPFRKASEYIHSPEELNEIVRDTIAGQAFFDRGLYSTPLMLLRIIFWWRNRGGGRGTAEKLKELALVRRRVQQLEQAALHLERRLGAPFVDVDAPLQDIARSARTVERLRLCLLWSFSDRFVRMDPIPTPTTGNYQIVLKPGFTNCHKINRSHVEKLFDGTGPFELLTLETSIFQIQLPRDNCTTSEMGEVAGHILYHESMEDLPVRWMILGPKKKKQVLLSVRIPTPDDTPDQRKACEQVLTGIENKKKEWKLKPHGQRSNFQIFTRENMKDSASKHFEKSLKNEFTVWLGVTLLGSQCINIASRGVPVLSKPFLMTQVPGCEAVRSLNSSSKLLLQFPLATATPTALVHDLPLGVRVLLSSVGHRRRSELMLTPDPSLVSAGSSSYVPVGLRKPEDTPTDPDPLKFKLTCDMASWVAVADSSELNCRVDTRSLIGRTSHMGTDPVYGVASSALYLGEDATFVILGNLTLFPRGQWVERGQYHLGGASGHRVEESYDSDSDCFGYMDSDQVDSESDSGDKVLGDKQSQWKEYAEELKACLREDHIPMSAQKYRVYVRRNLKLLDGIFGDIRNDPPQHYLDQIATDLVTKGKKAPSNAKSNDDDSSEQLPQNQQSKSAASKHHKPKDQQSKSVASQEHKQLTPDKKPRKYKKKQKTPASPAQQKAPASPAQQNVAASASPQDQQSKSVASQHHKQLTPDKKPRKYKRKQKTPASSAQQKAPTPPMQQNVAASASPQDQQSKSAVSQHHKQLTPDKKSPKYKRKQKTATPPAQQKATASTSLKHQQSKSAASQHHKQLTPDKKPRKYKKKQKTPASLAQQKAPASPAQQNVAASASPQDQQSKSVASQHHKQLTPDKKSRKYKRKQKTAAPPAQQKATASTAQQNVAASTAQQTATASASPKARRKNRQKAHQKKSSPAASASE